MNERVTPACTERKRTRVLLPIWLARLPSSFTWPSTLMQRQCLLLLRGLRSSAASLQATKTKSGSTADPGSKAILYSILTDTSVPLNSAQIWEQAEKAGIKSKRHTKHLLHSMRKAGAVQTKPVGKNQNFVYALRTKKDEAASETPSHEVTQGLH